MTTEFWKEYTDRCLMTAEELDRMYLERFGISRTEMNTWFLDDIDGGIKILEVGCNVGLQLMLLQKRGFRNLYGIESLPYAVGLSKNKTDGINIIQGDAFDIPFKDGYFDLIFTSGLLIHIPPDKVCDVMKEIYRCSKQYIWGYEYYEEEVTPIEYRGNDGLLWKANFPEIYCDNFQLKRINVELLYYEKSENRDVMFLLEKK